MANLLIDPPPGIVKDGTDQQATGRWRDGNLVRWVDGVLQPVGGWSQYGTQVDTPVSKTIFRWVPTDNGSNYMLGAPDALFMFVTGMGTELPIAVQTEVTPADLVAGTDYTLWSFDNWGNLPICLSQADGRILYVPMSGRNPASGSLTEAAVVDASAPEDNIGVLVTDERFLFALGADGDPKAIAWCDREDYTTWTPSATNEAGDFRLATRGSIVGGLKYNGQAMIMTTADAWVATYQGPPFVYGFNRIGTDCGLLGPNAAVATPAGVFWMGRKKFFAYDGGSVREVRCDVRSYIFPELTNQDTARCICALHIADYSEVWWLFPVAGETRNSRYVAYNYKDDHWTVGLMDRDCGVGSDGVWPSLFVKNSTKYIHEFPNPGGVLPTERDSAAYAETGPFALEDDLVFTANRLIPDEKTQGDVQVTFKTRMYPNGAETTHGPYSTANPTDVRFTGREVRMRVTETDNDQDWRVGIQKLRVNVRGDR
jgi:hypothetical protein